eukprot:1262843-Rhodomonas_salina.1
MVTVLTFMVGLQYCMTKDPRVIASAHRKLGLAFALAFLNWPNWTGKTSVLICKMVLQLHRVAVCLGVLETCLSKIGDSEMRLLHTMAVIMCSFVSPHFTEFVLEVG